MHAQTYAELRAEAMRTTTILVVLLVAALAFGGWQWYRASVFGQRAQDNAASAVAMSDRANLAEGRLRIADARVAGLEGELAALRATARPGATPATAQAPAQATGFPAALFTRCLAGDLPACLDAVSQLSRTR